ncbi:aspartate aminotransferase family protein [Brevibacillus halotolerans]|uniref:aspartate aminotransferase family protein n=1 Tax=Brevibacillus TaxID=55080 RepID=UPI00215C2BB6|nr:MULTISPECIES: aspartate aminotransferase family protein [Brevibacillus]MCR8961947.1 aspartate aminotransferase family protein [Brevibacillus laterosporus]MCZ0834102.1 aspartate aminotransferase family protein [Brevibacillus halotolerans]
MTTYLGPSGILDKRKEYFYPCTAHFYERPPQLVRGDMQYLYDSTGKAYTDFFSGVSVVACGHCNPAITAATIKQLETLQHTCTIYLTEPNVALAEKMASILPGNMKRTFFVNSGSEANEAALTLARLATGKKEFMALESGLHGRTFLTMSVTGIPMWRSDNYLEEGVSFIPRPYDPNLNEQEAVERSLSALRKVLEEKGDRIAAMIVEPMQGNGGIVPAPLSYFTEVKKLLEKHHVLLIADEIQTGFGRTGKMFAIDHYGIVPDILTMAKALGNGVPIAAFATTDEIAAHYNRPSASTLGGNPVSSMTALAVLSYIENEQLIARAEQLGKQLKEGLLFIQTAYRAAITDVRGLGLMIGMELYANEPEKAAPLVDSILEEMKDRGFIIGKNGVNRNVIAFQPPLVITEQDITNMLEALADTLKRLL